MWSVDLVETLKFTLTHALSLHKVILLSIYRQRNKHNYATIAQCARHQAPIYSSQSGPTFIGLVGVVILVEGSCEAWLRLERLQTY